MYSDKPVLIIGGGVSGLTAAIEAAESGAKVILLERDHFLGGRVFRMHQYFPKLCSPQCGMEINFQRIRANRSIEILTSAQVESISGEAGNFSVKIEIGPQMINDNCTACGDCAAVCPVEMDDDFNYSMKKKKAIFMDHPMVYPPRYAIEEKACDGSSCSKCVEACKYEAINLSAKKEEKSLEVGAIVFATGWKPYDAANIENLGFGTVPNVINNVMMERIAAPEGPTEGKIRRPSDDKEVKNIAFIQCAGSRDENHLPYCSTICCMATLKQATYVREAYPDSNVTIFYIDIRAPGKYETFYQKISADEKVTLIKGKVAKIEADPKTNDVILTAEDIMGGEKKEYRMDMAVLATGMVPNLNGRSSRLMVELDENGFVNPEKLPPGIFVAGVAEMPADVNTSVLGGTAAALGCMQVGG